MEEHVIKRGLFALLLLLLLQPLESAEISTPATEALFQRLSQYQRHMAAWLSSGVVALDTRGYLIVRNLDRAPEAERQQVRNLLQRDHRDRDAWVYIQKSRGGSDPHHWLFRRTLAQLPAGSWFQSAKGWQQKAPQ